MGFMNKNIDLISNLSLYIKMNPIKSFGNNFIISSYNIIE